jgi:Fe-S cluster biogenesis protein NfuA
MPSLSSIQTVLDRLRPALQADGGDIELVEVRGRVAHVRLTGACHGCPTAHLTIHLGVEAALRRLHPQLHVAVVA